MAVRFCCHVVDDEHVHVAAKWIACGVCHRIVMPSGFSFVLRSGRVKAPDQRPRVAAPGKASSPRRRWPDLAPSPWPPSPEEWPREPGALPSVLAPVSTMPSSVRRTPAPPTRTAESIAGRKGMLRASIDSASVRSGSTSRWSPRRREHHPARQEEAACRPASTGSAHSGASSAAGALGRRPAGAARSPVAAPEVARQRGKHLLQRLLPPAEAPTTDGLEDHGARSGLHAHATRR